MIVAGVDTHRDRHAALQTVSEYRVDLARFAEFAGVHVGIPDIAALDRDILREYQGHLARLRTGPAGARRPLAISTRSRRLVALRSFLRFAACEKWLPGDLRLADRAVPWAADSAATMTAAGTTAVAAANGVATGIGDREPPGRYGAETHPGPRWDIWTARVLAAACVAYLRASAWWSRLARAPAGFSAMASTGSRPRSSASAVIASPALSASHSAPPQ